MTESFLDRLRGYGASDAIVDGSLECDYSRLVARVDRWRDELARARIAPGEVVALDGARGVEGVAALLALACHTAVVVPLAAPAGRRRRECLRLAQVERELSIHADTGRIRLAETGTTADHVLYRRLRTSGSSGLVLFSSGTTGTSKAVVLDFGRMLRSYRPRRPMRTLFFLGLDHIGGINTLLRTLASGGTVIGTEERTPDAVCATVAANRVALLPTTPTFLTMLLVSRAHERHDLSSLQLVTYGTEPMPPATLGRLRQVLPDVRFKQTYGLSELGILPTKSRTDDSVWMKVGGPGFDYKIVDGILWVRSELAMLGYLNAEDRFDAEGYFNTQDAVETDGEYLRVIGRVSEVINVGGLKVYPAEVENVLLELPIVAEATVWGRPSHVSGQVAAATVKLATGIEGSGAVDRRAVIERIKDHCRQRLEAYKVPMLIELTEAHRHSDRFKKLRRPG